MAIQDHPNWNTIRTFTESMIITVKNKQAEYFAKNKAYFQGLKIPSTGQLDGEVAAFIDYGKHPEDQADSWFTFAPETYKDGIKFPVHAQIDVYQAPNGWGWILTLELWKAGLGPDKYGNDGDHWVFSHNEGPEMYGGIYDDWYIEPVMDV